MPRAKLDGPGSIKMATLDEALVTLQGVHGVVEQMALAERNGQPLGPMLQRLKRTCTPLAGQLKGQFGTISDYVTGMLLSATRGASDRARIRSLRENVASIRMQIEAAQRRVEEVHAVKEPPTETRSGG